MKNPLASIWRPAPAPPAFGQGQQIPDRDSNLVSRILFTWLTPILAVGWTRPLQNDDLWEVNPERRAAHVGTALEDNFFKRCPPDRRPRKILLKSDIGASQKVVTRWGGAGDDATTDSDGFSQTKETSSIGADDAVPRAPSPWRARFSRFKVGSGGGGTGPSYDESLTRALHETFCWAWWKAGFFKFIADTLLTTSPLVTRALLTYLGKVYAHHRDSSSPEPPSIGYGIGLAIILYAMQQLSSLCANAFLFQSMTIGFLVRTSVISCIFRKSLRLSGRSRLRHSVGQIATMVSTDATRLDTAASHFHGTWTGPIQIILGMILLIRNMGYSALVALAVLVFGIPLQAIIVKRMVAARKGAVHITDKRVRLVEEVLQGIRLLVLFGWQGPYAERVVGLRRAELVRIRNVATYKGLMFCFTFFIPVLAAVLSFITYALTNHPLDAAIVFSSLQYLNVIRNPLVLVPLISSTVGDAYIGLGRISKLLTAEEMEGDYPIEKDSKFAVRLHGDFTWEETAAPTTVEASSRTKLSTKVTPGAAGEAGQNEKVDPHDEKGTDGPAPFSFQGLHVEIPKGKFVAIVGRIGSGKSSLLQAMAGEMRKIAGEVVFGGSVAYVAQSPWIQNMTLRENIVFGQDDDEGLFREVIRACALQPDLEMLPDGEATEIGERGINLSGGQKARVGLARAAYYDADVLLLDDPLSAVDPHVSKHIVDQCLLHGPMANKTRILATHQLHVIPQTDYIYFLQDGRITEQGTYAELISQGKDFAKLVEEFGNAEEADDAAAQKAESAKEPTKDLPAAALKKGAALMQREEKAEGDLEWAVYKDYIRAAGSLSWAPLLLILITIAQCFRVANTVILGLWSENNIPGLGQTGYIILFATTGLGQALFVYAGSFAFSYAGFFASLTLFRRALGSVLGSPMSFFDTTPIGRIMARLTKDIDTLDSQLPDAWYQLLAQVSSVFGTIGLVIWSYNWLGLMFPPLIILFFIVIAFYRRTSCEAQRLDSLLRSLLYASYTEALTGLPTIRAFREQNRFVKVTEHNVDIGNRAYFLTIACQRWLTVRVDAMGNAIILGIALASVGFGKTTNPATLGVVLSYALSITSFLGQLIRQMAQVEQDMNVVERVLYYGRLPQEGAATTPEDPPTSWPERGAVEFKDVKLCYRPGLPLVLNGVSFKVLPGENVGVVGRTGAGKSSLLSALFRVVHPLAEGKVEIDGVDVSKIGLETLRWRLSIIPQDTVLFGGSLRLNLDPTGKVTDQELHAALRRVGLVTSEGRDDRSRFDLDAEVRDDGFSAGEKQLIALCRALVKNSQIIVLDEATASVDVQTDSQIQKMIQQDFKDKTVICIAHRLNTIVFYDRILVMDAGKVAEFDTPLALFDREGSIFREMCDKASLTRDDIVKIRENARVYNLSR